MIAGLLSTSNLYFSISSLFEKSFEFIKSLDENTPNGEYVIVDGLKAIVMEYDTLEKFPFGWEAHRKYIDIQYCLRGKERIQWTPLLPGLIPTIDYDETNDRTFYAGRGEDTFIDTGDGVFAMFFPKDAHAPQMFVDKSEFIKKVVVKVPVSSLIIE